MNLLKLIGKDVPDNVQKTALAAFASQFYNGIENIIKRIHKDSGITLPIGDNWHIQLLQRCSLKSDFIFTLKFNDELYSNLNDLRRFRHYFFHGYSINIDWNILKESIEEIDEIFTEIKKVIMNI